MNYCTEISPINEFTERKNNKTPTILHTSTATESQCKRNANYEGIEKKHWALLNHSGKIELFPSHQNGAYMAPEVCFIICNNCFWCASLLNPKRFYSKCPECRQPNIESMLIVEDENYKSRPISINEAEEMEFSG
ncbi:MAG TPA: hypothetical protein VF884_08630 [Nitrososphaeraceae archaeon]